MPRNAAMNTIKLPVRFGRFLGRKLDPRRRESLEDSLRIRNSRLEERQERLAQRAADHEQRMATRDVAPTPAELAHEAEQTEGRRRIRRGAEVADLFDFGGVILRLVIVAVRGLLRVIGGVLEGLAIFDV